MSPRRVSAKMIPAKQKDNPTRGLTAACRLNRWRERGLEKAMVKVAVIRERSEKLSMHCMTSRVYSLYYTLFLPRLPSSRTIFSGRDFLPDGSSLLPGRYICHFSLLLAFFLSLFLRSYSLHIPYVPSPLCAPVIWGIYVNAISDSRTLTTRALARGHIRAIETARKEGKERRVQTMHLCNA